MTEKEYLELEKRIAEREKFDRWKAEEELDKHERRCANALERSRMAEAGENPFPDDGAPVSRAKVAGDSFTRLQLSTEG